MHRGGGGPAPSSQTGKPRLGGSRLLNCGFGVGSDGFHTCRFLPHPHAREAHRHPEPCVPILRKSVSRASSSKVMGTGVLVPGEPVRRLEGSEVLPPPRPGPQDLPISQTD